MVGKGKKANGRPTKFSTSFGDKICDQIADGQTLTEICKQKGYPHRVTVLRWCRNQEKFRIAYTQAREDQQHIFGDGMLERARDETRDYNECTTERYNNEGVLISTKTEKKSDNTAVQRDKLVVDTLWKLMQSLAASSYGNKIEQQLTGKDGKDLPAPVVNINVSSKPT